MPTNKPSKKGRPATTAATTKLAHVPADATTVDRRAIEVLFATYWTGSVWRDWKSRFTPPDDFEYAKRAGVMFDPVRLSHDAIVRRAVVVIRTVERRAVADAFVVSLSSRRLELRSALGSFAVLQHFPQHKDPRAQVKFFRKGDPCPVCGELNRAVEVVDLNVLNFERFKWGGVRHDEPLYASLDLGLFQQLPGVTPVAADIAVLKGLLRAIEAAPMETSSAKLEKHLAKVFESNKTERDKVLCILGLCGILGTPAHPGYMRKFVPYSERDLPGRRFVDMQYPACWWQRSDGINQEAVAYWFGHLL
jgi:hypothetical protein